jgi:hypothetical protein
MVVLPSFLCACLRVVRHVEYFLAVLLKVLQRTVYGGDYRARGNGGAGELVKHAAIFFYLPAAGSGVGQ